MLDSVFGWIGELVHWMAQFIPRWVIVPATHGAVKFVRGHTIVPIKPGIHWYWPVTTMFCEYPVARQTTNLRAQTLVTSDDKTIAVAGLVVYRVKNIEAILGRTFDPDATIEEVALSGVMNTCSRKTWDDLKNDHESGALDVQLQDAIQKDLRRYGIKVLKTTLTDLAPCRVVKLMMSQAHHGV